MWYDNGELNDLVLGRRLDWVVGASKYAADVTVIPNKWRYNRACTMAVMRHINAFLGSGLEKSQ